MLRNTPIVRVLAALALATPLAAAAGPGGEAKGSERPAFDEADANGDGDVTIQEAVQAGAPEAEAKQEDLDDDGKLTRADWQFVQFEQTQKTGQTGQGAS